MVEVCSLSSGSRGNAFFIKTGNNAFLVDAGISCKQLCSRLEQIGHSIENIKGIFITHEHTDHVQGLRVLLKRFPIPLYVSSKTYRRLGLSLNGSPLEFIASRDRIEIDDTIIESLPKSHDAVDPSLFSFYYKGKKISVVTDAGHICKNVVTSVRDAHILFLESNYDEDMLWNGIYPYPLKKRIAGNQGHLSNVCAADLIRGHAEPGLQHVFLSHLSENNNTPEAALATFRSIVAERGDLEGLNVHVTGRHEPSRRILLPT